MFTEIVLIIHISCQIRGLFKVLRVHTQSQPRPLRPLSAAKLKSRATPAIVRKENTGKEWSKTAPKCTVLTDSSALHLADGLNIAAIA